ncbi:MAG: diaminopimelate epimerase [Burkholderiaceae bacterium]|nr:MAG: diaminopimelate epimerase [Burkholderiaceae bacterium]
MKLKFTKMHGAGNDFIVLDGIHQQLDLSAAQWRALADRHFGVGADQILVVEAAQNPAADFRYRIFNADGGEVEQCGNGARCFVRFVHDKKLTQKTEITVETMCGLITPRLETNGQVTVNMGAPRTAPAQIPFDSEGLQPQTQHEDQLWPLGVAGEVVQLSLVSMGNPHAVQVVADVETAPVAVQGPLIEHHPRFPQRVNAGFMQIIDRHQIALRVWERGAGETLACGTGACAAVVAGIRRGLLDSPVQVRTRGGTLGIAWDGDAVWLTGPAVTVFEGEITL